MISLTCRIYDMTQMNLLQTETHSEDRLVLPVAGGTEREFGDVIASAVCCADVTPRVVCVCLNSPV